MAKKHLGIARTAVATLLAVTMSVGALPNLALAEMSLEAQEALAEGDAADQASSQDNDLSSAHEANPSLDAVVANVARSLAESNDPIADLWDVLAGIALDEQQGASDADSDQAAKMALLEGQSTPQGVTRAFVCVAKELGFEAELLETPENASLARVRIGEQTYDLDLVNGKPGERPWLMAASSGTDEYTAPEPSTTEEPSTDVAETETDSETLEQPTSVGDQAARDEAETNKEPATQAETSNKPTKAQGPTGSSSKSSVEQEPKITSKAKDTSKANKDAKTKTTSQKQTTPSQSQGLESQSQGLESQAAKTPNVYYRTHIQTYDWERGWRSNGQISGTTGKSKRLEGIYIKLGNLPVSGSIRYKTHVQTYGWQGWASAGQMSGTTGQSKRLEAIQISLTGNMAKKYDVWYRVHAQTFGWMGWAKNGASSGTEGFSKRLEAIQIVLLPRGSSAPAANYKGAKRATAAAFKRQIPPAISTSYIGTYRQNYIASRNYSSYAGTIYAGQQYAQRTVTIRSISGNNVTFKVDYESAYTAAGANTTGWITSKVNNGRTSFNYWGSYGDGGTGYIKFSGGNKVTLKLTATYVPAGRGQQRLDADTEITFAKGTVNVRS